MRDFRYLEPNDDGEEYECDCDECDEREPPTTQELMATKHDRLKRTMRGVSFYEGEQEAPDAN